MSEMSKREMVYAVLAAIFSLLGVVSIFCTQFLAAELGSQQKIILFVVGIVLLNVGGICLVRWRRNKFQNSGEK